MKDWKENISFILIEPKEPGNIGSSARAMKNMGFMKLELVKPVAFMTDEAKWMSCHAVDVLEHATVYSSFKAAIKDKNMIIGTTRRIGKQRGPILPLTACVNKIIAAAKKNNIAILFGREDRGLFNKEIEKCGFLMTIPANPLFPSLNLAQSVLLVAYELSRRTYKKAAPELVHHEKLEVLYKHINTTLRILEYIPRGNRDLEKKIMNNIKHLFGRSGLTEWECNMLHGLCTRIENKMKGNSQELSR
jgi:TrmH family RNA methyltransferase